MRKCRESRQRHQGKEHNRNPDRRALDNHRHIPSLRTPQTLFAIFAYNTTEGKRDLTDAPRSPRQS